MNGQMDFYRNWTDYDAGFGDLRYEFWLGLENIYRLTSSQSHELRVDLEDWDGSTAYAEYSQFSISGPDDFYRLSVSGYTGTAGDSINVAASDQNQNNQQFSTPDQDHDNSATLHCAKGNNHGGWWFNACGYANLNGRSGKNFWQISTGAAT
nr:hypothetical protein BaRGS_012203 [Batillaria attramentaria]KAG5689856.1 hypothetical protein BaRGS_012206 [Batillaria attramentaria]